MAHPNDFFLLSPVTAYNLIPEIGREKFCLCHIIAVMNPLCREDGQVPHVFPFTSDLVEKRPSSNTLLAESTVSITLLQIPLCIKMELSPTLMHTSTKNRGRRMIQHDCWQAVTFLITESGFDCVMQRYRQTAHGAVFMCECDVETCEVFILKTYSLEAFVSVWPKGYRRRLRPRHT